MWCLAQSLTMKYLGQLELDFLLLFCFMISLFLTKRQPQLFCNCLSVQISIIFRMKSSLGPAELVQPVHFFLWLWEVRIIAAVQVWPVLLIHSLGEYCTALNLEIPQILLFVAVLDGFLSPETAGFDVSLGKYMHSVLPKNKVVFWTWVVEGVIDNCVMQPLSCKSFHR